MKKSVVFGYIAALAAAGCTAAPSQTGASSPAVARSTAVAASDDPALLERARALHRRFPLVDGHNDLPDAIRERAAGDLVRMDPRGSLPALQTDFPRLRQGGVGGLFWAAYVPVSTIADRSAARYTREQIDLIRRMVASSPEMEFATTAADIERIHRAGRIASLIGIEGGHAIQNSLDTLRAFHGLGARYLTLTHSSTIEWADAATDSARHGGLSPFGEQVVREMNRLGMLVDLSHVSPETMDDAIRVSRAPVIFSHSSARAIADHPRNVPDAILRRLPANGGLVMVNFFSGFVVPEGARAALRILETQRELRARFPGDPAGYRAAYQAWLRENPIPRGTIGNIADHIDHVRRVAGIDHVGLGSDYDGVTALPVGMESVADFPRLTAELLRRGYSDEEVGKVLGGNLLRVMRSAEGVAARGGV